MAVELRHPETERALLAAAFLAPAIAEQYARELRADDFTDPRHKLIFEALRRVLAAEMSVDLRTMQADLEARGELQRAGGLAFLAGLDVDLPDLDHVEDYARLVRAATVRRGVLDACKEAAKQIQGGGSTTETIGELSTVLRELEESTASPALVTLGGSLDPVFERIRNPRHSSLVGITSGYSDLDRLTLGWLPGQLIVLAARPGIGKTALASSWALAAIRSGVPTAFVSLEMGREELAARMLSSETGIEHWRLKTGHMSTIDIANVRKTWLELDQLPLWLDDSPYLSPSKLAATLRRAKREKGVRMAVVDYLGLMRVDEDSRAENQNLRIAEITRSLKVMAKELEMPIVALHQLSRAPEKRPDARPVLSDLRDSGAVEQDADLVLFIYREVPKPNDPATEAEIIIGKHRNGPTGTVRVHQRLEVFRFDPRREELPVYASQTSL